MHELDPSHQHPVRAEIFRAARLCAPCMDRLGTLTFDAPPLNKTLRDLWCDTILATHLLPAITAAHLATTGSGGYRELLDIDARLDSNLPVPIAHRSLAAGRMIATDVRPPAAERTLSRYIGTIGSVKSSAHLATVLSARAAIFHIPPRMALSALVFLEMRSAPVAEFWTCVEECLQRVPQSGQFLRAA